MVPVIVILAIRPISLYLSVDIIVQACQNRQCGVCAILPLFRFRDFSLPFALTILFKCSLSQSEILS